MTALPHAGHRHQALLYRGEHEFVEHVAAFLRAGLEAGDEVLAAVSRPKFGVLTEALGDRGRDIGFLDMDDVGRNPGRLISAWHDFVSKRPGRRVRGVGEPTSVDRTADELTECEASEALWNIAFEDRDVWVMCPYDTKTLAPEHIDSVLRTHPAVVVDGAPEHSTDYSAPWASVLGKPLIEPERVRTTFPFGPLHGVRTVARDAAYRAGAPTHRIEDFVVAVNEVAGNSLRHGGGEGVLRVWDTPDGVVCEVADQGRLEDPLVGRLRPSPDRQSGRGLWMAHQLCDLVQVRSGEQGTVVRLHLRAD